MVAEIKEVLRLNPNHADALNYLGYSYAERGIHLEEAITLVQKALELKLDS
jgi:Flp pilus assembly protein TadD